MPRPRTARLAARSRSRSRKLPRPASLPASTPSVPPTSPGGIQRPPPPELYRQNFTAAECAALDGLDPLSAVSEIAILRILLARVLTALRGIKATLNHHYRTLVAFSQAGMTMSSLARIQFRLDGPPPDPVFNLLAVSDLEDL